MKIEKYLKNQIDFSTPTGARELQRFLKIFGQKIFSLKTMPFKMLSRSNRSENINWVKKTKVAQNLILHLLDSSKYFSIVNIIDQNYWY